MVSWSSRAPAWWPVCVTAATSHTVLSSDEPELDAHTFLLSPLPSHMLWYHTLPDWHDMGVLTVLGMDLAHGTFVR